MNAAPFSFTNCSAGSPALASSGSNCLSLRVSNGSWREHYKKRQGFICQKRDGVQTTLPFHDFLTALICQDPFLVIELHDEKVINIQLAFFRTRDCNISTQPGHSNGAVKDTFCIVTQLVDLCPSVQKGVNIAFTCQDGVCGLGLGVEDQSIGDEHLSISSSVEMPTKSL